MKNAATVKYPWTKTEATPTLTGLPPHITILANFEKLRVELEASKVAILSGVEAELDKRRIGSQSHFNKEEILERMLGLHNELLRRTVYNIYLKSGKRFATDTAIVEDDLDGMFDGMME